MRQTLTFDSVDCYIEARPERLYDIVADVTRTPELTPDIIRCKWTGGATGPAVGARFRATNKFGRGPRVSNQPVVMTAERGQEFSFSRSAPFAGTLEWRYRFEPEKSGTRVVESYTVTKPISALGWFLLAAKGSKDRRHEMRQSMIVTLQRLGSLDA